MRSRDVVEDDEIELFKDPTLRRELIELGVPPSLPFREAYFKSLETDVRKSVVKAGLDPEKFPGLAHALNGEDNPFTDSCGGE